MVAFYIPTCLLATCFLTFLLIYSRIYSRVCRSARTAFTLTPTLPLPLPSPLPLTQREEDAYFVDKRMTSGGIADAEMDDATQASSILSILSIVS